MGKQKAKSADNGLRGTKRVTLKVSIMLGGYGYYCTVTDKASGVQIHKTLAYTSKEACKQAAIKWLEEAFCVIRRW